jgi:hypothetical protein
MAVSFAFDGEKAIVRDLVSVQEIDSSNSQWQAINIGLYQLI